MVPSLKSLFQRESVCCNKAYRWSRHFWVDSETVLESKPKMGYCERAKTNSISLQINKDDPNSLSASYWARQPSPPTQQTGSALAELSEDDPEASACTNMPSKSNRTRRDDCP